MTAEPKKIIVFGGFAESLVIFRKAMLKALVDRGHEVTACAPAASADVVGQLAGIGVRYQNIPLNRTGGNLVQDVGTLRALVRLLRAEKPDILLSYTIKPVIYGSLAARLAGVPHAFAMITGASKAFAEDPGIKHRLVRGVMRLLYRISLPYNDAVLFQNPDDQALFRQFSLVRPAQQLVTINGSGVNLDDFQATPLPADGPSFLLIARLIKEKGIREYVEAARIIRQKHPRTVFRLVGWIDDQPGAITNEELSAWEREGVIEYLGKLDDVRPAIAASSVYVLPSYYPEGTPRSVLEAMAIGRPIITTDMPGCRETVQPEINGCLVAPKDPRSLADAMERFIGDPERIETFGRESRRIAQERYDVHKVNADILTTLGLT